MPYLLIQSSRKFTHPKLHALAKFLFSKILYVVLDTKEHQLFRSLAIYNDRVRILGQKLKSNNYISFYSFYAVSGLNYYNME